MLTLYLWRVTNVSIIHIYADCSESAIQIATQFETIYIF